MFYSTYKSSRVLSRDFGMTYALKFRGLAEYISNRPWNNWCYFIIPGDVRIIIVGLSISYFPRKWFVDHQDSSELASKTVLMRWGGSIEEVRKNLSPADQVRARFYHEYEKHHAFFLSKNLYIKQDGCPLAGPELYSQNHH